MEQAQQHEKKDDANVALETLMWGLRALLKRWPIVVAMLLLGGGIALAYSKSLPRIYEATTTIEFVPDVIKPLGNKGDPGMGWSSIWDTHEYYETQYKIIQSDHVLSMVVRDLGLQNDAEFLGGKPANPISMEDAVAMLRGRLVVEPLKGSRLVLLHVRDQRPPLARRLAEGIARTYIDQNLEKTISATGDTVTWLSGQLDHFKNELEANENSLHEFKRVNDLPSSTFDDLSKMVRIEMQEYDSALTHTRLKRQELTARARELSKVNPDTVDEIPASELLANPNLGNLRKQYQDAVRERAELIAEGKGENHPSVKRVDEKIGLSKTLLLAETRAIQGAAERDLAIIEQQENGESGLYEGARRKAVDLNLKELEFHRLDRMRAQNEKLYAILLEQLKEADLRRMMNTNNVRLIDTPTEPRFPVAPRVSTNVAAGLVSGLILGLVLAFVREAIDNTLKTPDDVEKRLQLTFLGLLPEFIDDVDQPQTEGKRKRWLVRRRKRIHAPELIVHDDPSSGIAEAARSLRTNLLFMNPDKPYRRLLVTSAAPSEGKTTVAVSVAVTLAQSGQRVCILDCDLRRPRLHHIFDRAGDVGIMNVILGEATVEEAAKPTVVPNLSCIPCGPIPPSPADVITSAKFRQMLDMLGERFDRIVIDSPPVMAVTDAAILSTLADGVLLVARAFKTSIKLAKTGLRQLRDVDAPIAGGVLNGVNLTRHQYYYEGYYYYGRGDRYQQQGQSSDGETASKDAPSPPPN